ncbi:nuclear transport factor 2 family protein [Microbacterium sp. RD1]|uniref:nuclear transport factor 2 family protein n=1 Tax=Microbacterium sp. RD1 TaxID=3457313 RepID=UPI003FA5F6B3
MSDVSPADWVGIAGVVASLAHAQDDQDWRRFRDLFAEEMTLDQSAKIDEAAIRLTADELTAKARETLEGFAVTHHAPSVPLIEVHGNVARCRTHMVAYHHLPRDGVDYCTMRGYWDLELIRSADGWSIRRWAVVRTAPWEGDPDLYRVAREREHRVA